MIESEKENSSLDIDQIWEVITESDQEDSIEILQDFLEGLGIEILIEDLPDIDSSSKEKSQVISELVQEDTDEESNSDSETDDSEEDSVKDDQNSELDLGDLIQDSDNFEDFIETVDSYDSVSIAYNETEGSYQEAFGNLIKADVLEAEYASKIENLEGQYQEVINNIDPELGSDTDSSGYQEISLDVEVSFELEDSEVETYEEGISSSYQEMADEAAQEGSTYMDLETGNQLQQTSDQIQDDGLMDQDTGFEAELDISQYGETEQDIISSVDQSQIEEDSTYHVCAGCHEVHEAGEYDNLGGGHQKAGSMISGSELQQAAQALE
jgi:hypothetical protein